MDIFKELQFTQEWIELGIITPDQLNQIEDEWRTSDDQNPEHYRWRAFLDFSKANPFLDDQTLRRLYSLGTSDADRVMGGSIMVHVLRRKDCPEDLLLDAADSEEKYLREIAQERLASVD